jgi:two-component system sensor histidine kinase RegB
MREEGHAARSAKALHGVAAQVAHSLSTPLGTMAIEIGELRAGTLTSAERTDTLDTLAKQVEVCKEHLSHLLASTGGARGDGARSMRVDALAHALCEDYELMHPAATVELDVDGVEPAPSTVVERTLYDALVSLLDECGRDPPYRVTVVVTWGASDLTIRVAGAGSWAVSQINFPGQIAKPVAPPAFDGGRGSLTLAATIVDRFGGTVSYRPGTAGKWVQVVLPLAMSRSKQP